MPIIFPESKPANILHPHAHAILFLKKKNRNKGSIFVLKHSTSRKESENKIRNIFQSRGAPFYLQGVETNSALVYIFIGDYICWTFFFSAPVGGVNFLSILAHLHFGRYKFKFFDGRLTANKRLPITDSCQKIYKNVVEKSKTNQYTLAKGDYTKTRNENEERKSKRKLETVGNGKMS